MEASGRNRPSIGIKTLSFLGSPARRQRKQRQILPISHKSKPNGNNISLNCNFEKDKCSIKLNRKQCKGSVTGHYSHILNLQNPARKFGTCAITGLCFFKTFYL